jgi:hypothetical protein
VRREGRRGQAEQDRKTGRRVFANAVGIDSYFG